jgi:putative DNA primase/helicase
MTDNNNMERLFSLAINNNSGADARPVAERIAAMPMECFGDFGNFHAALRWQLERQTIGDFELTRETFRQFLSDHRHLSPNLVVAELTRYNKAYIQAAKPADLPVLVTAVQNDYERREGQRMAVEGLKRLKASGAAGKGIAGAEAIVNRYSDGEAVLVSLSDVQPQPINWLWRERIAAGKLTMISGDPGNGKSFLTLDIAARVSTGSPWPDGSPNSAGNVILISAEDDVADTVRPRLDACSADVRRISMMQGQRKNGKLVPFSLADVESLKNAVAQVGNVRMIVIDPISAYMSGADSHNNAEVRGLLAPLSQLAMDSGAAIVAVTHLNKGQGRAMYRSVGSLAFVAAARASFLVSKDKDDDKRRLFLPIKNNIGNDQDGLAFSIVNGAVSWERGPVTITADAAMATEPGRPPRRREDAAQWLNEQLVEGPVKSAHLLARAGEIGISDNTLRRAKAELGVRVLRTGFGAGAEYEWELPTNEDDRPF